MKNDLTGAELHARHESVGGLRCHPATVFTRRKTVSARLLEALERAALRELLRPSAAEGGALLPAERETLARDVVVRVKLDDVITKIQTREQLLFFAPERLGAEGRVGPAGALRRTPGEDNHQSETQCCTANHRLHPRTT